MRAEDAPSAEMRQPPRPRPGADPLALDDASVDRLLTGTLRAADAPPGYERVAELLAATVAPPTSRELAGQAAVLAEFRALARARAAAAPPPRRPRRRRRFGLAVVAVAGALVTGGAAAAATGHLPGPVAQAARSILTVTGDGPATPSLAEPAPGRRPAGSGGTGPGAAPSTDAAGHGPGATAAGPATQPDIEGLCRAYLASKGGEQGGQLDATAFQALAAAAGGEEKLPAFCQRLLPAKAKHKDDKKAPQPDPPGEGQGQGGPPPTTGGGQDGTPATNPPPPPTSRGNGGSAPSR